MDAHTLTSKLTQHLRDNREAVQLIGSIGAGVTLYTLVRQIRQHARDPLRCPPSSISKKLFFSLFTATAISPRIKLSLLDSAVAFSLSFISVHKFCLWLRARLGPSNTPKANIDPLEATPDSPEELPGPQIARDPQSWKKSHLAHGSFNAALASLHKEHGS